MWNVIYERREQDILVCVIRVDQIESVLEHFAPVVMQFAPVYTDRVKVVKGGASLRCYLPAALFMLGMSFALRA